MPYFYVDRYYWILIIPTMLFAFWAQSRVSSTFNKYSKVMSHGGYTAAEVCRRILDSNGLYHVRIEHISGNLTDHFDPSANVVRLSDTVYNSRSVASIGVAAHEVGHAIQYAVGYVPIRIRAAIIPVTNFGSKLSIPLILLGFVFQWQPVVNLGIILFSLMTLFQLVTLPVELNASRRALRTLEGDSILYGEEVSQAKSVLTAAALTYVAALLTSAAQLLRLILLYGRRNNRN
ncbi:MAG: zinc metallopeptidase [Oscillospiraceae bacterium]|nr:zinc metallopeptidase [Oscillospiraceae bacterium]